MLAQFDGIEGKDINDSLVPFLVFTLDLPEIFIDAVSAIIRTCLQRYFPEDFMENGFDYVLLKLALPESITDQVWAATQ